MSFDATMKILFKSHILSSFIFWVVMSAGMIVNNSGFFSLILAAGFIALYFLGISAAVYYTLGIIVHRLYLKFRLYNVLYSLALSIALGFVYLFFADWNTPSFLLALTVTVPQCLIIWFFTKQELKKNAV